MLHGRHYHFQWGTSQAGALSITAFEHGQFVPLPGGQRNIVVENNLFEDNDGTNVLITSAENVTLNDNRFLQPMQNATTRGEKRGVDPTALIWMTECSGVQIAGNVLAHPGPYFKTTIVATPTVTGTGFADGVMVQK